MTSFMALPALLVAVAAAPDASEPAAEQDLSSTEVAALMKASRSGRSKPPGVEVIVPVAFFTMVASVVGLVLVFRSKREHVRHETIRLAIERGADIPTELLLPPDPRRSDVRRGLVLFMGGAGLALMLSFLEPDEQAWAVGIFPLMTGAGYLAYAWLERRGLG